MLGLSVISPEDLQHELHGPEFIKTFRNLSIEKSQTDGYYILLMDYVHSPYRDFESYLRNLTGLSECDIQLLSKQYISKIITHKNFLGAYTFKDLSDVLSRGFRNEVEITGRIRPNHRYDKSDSNIIESDIVSLIFNLNLSPQIIVLTFDKKSFFKTILGSAPYHTGIAKVMIMNSMVKKIEI